MATLATFAKLLKVKQDVREKISKKKKKRTFSKILRIKEDRQKKIDERNKRLDRESFTSRSK